MILNHSKTIRSVISLLCSSAMVPTLVENSKNFYCVFSLFVYFFCKSRHTVVCLAAQEAGA